MSTIKQSIKQWDGKSVDDIRAVYDRFCPIDSFSSELIDLLQQSKSQPGASWLLKHALEQGASLDSEQTSKLLSHLQVIHHWESRLHLLQSLPFIKIEPNQKKSTERFLRHQLNDSNKFIRAWSYNGFYLLAQQYPEYQQEADQFLTMAMRDEAPSVKARIRNIRKEQVL